MPVDEPTEESPGVFGNLPKTRPGARSPRRDERPGAGSDTQATPPPPPAAADDKEPDPAVAPAAPQPGPRGVEDVAWAGVAAAAEAATIGVRLATRALEAMRDTVDRR